jgi:hypothetical protein
VPVSVALGAIHGVDALVYVQRVCGGVPRARSIAFVATFDLESAGSCNDYFPVGFHVYVTDWWSDDRHWVYSDVGFYKQDHTS